MIGRNTCPVIKMRREEIVNGKAIYFIDREKLKAANAMREQAVKAPDYSSKSPKRKGQATAFYQPTKQPEQVEAPAEKEADLFDNSGYAAAINSAIKTEVKKAVEMESAPTPPTPTAQPAKSGLSLIEMARLRASNNQ